MENQDMFSMLSFTELIFIFALGILMIVSQWRIYEKAGKPGWASIIPIYNFVVLLQIVGKPVWWIIWMFIPGANLVVAVWVTNLLSKSFGKNETFTLGLIFLGFIFYPVLAFGDASYQGPAGSLKTTVEV